MSDGRERDGRPERTDGQSRAGGRDWPRPTVPLPPGRRSRPPAPPERYRYSMAELEAQTGFNQRTIRYYITRGLLPPAHGRGPSATYDESHLLRLKAIQLRRARNQPLEEIKVELAQLGDEEIAVDLRIETKPPEDRWRRITLHHDIELHVREPGGERDRRVEEAVELIVKLARSVIDQLEQGE